MLFLFCFQEMNKVTRKIRPVFGATLALSAVIPFMLALFAKQRIDFESSIPLHQYEQQIYPSQRSADVKGWGDADT